MTTDNIKQQLQTIMETTQEEDKQYLNEVKEEIKKKKTSWKTTDIYNRRSKRESKTIRFKTIQRK